ncbi:MAG TPA: hypothetical protein VED43_00015 [Mycobacterium sp.]|nr:hypothetical protein [Mycobacterium sp.]
MRVSIGQSLKCLQYVQRFDQECTSPSVTSKGEDPDYERDKAGGGRIWNMSSIRARPIEADTREVAGHWEADLVYGMRPSAVATLFELRAALDDFELCGQQAHAAVVDAVSRFPADSAFPSLARARAALASADPQLG